MYAIYVRNGDETVCIYNDINASDDRKVISPKLTLTENGAGELSMKLSPTNIGNDKIVLFGSEIIVKKKGVEIWSGRAINIKEDFYKNKTYTCEGELSYLNDITQPQIDYEETDTYHLLKTYLDNYNEKATDDMQFTLGAVSVSSEIEYTYTNYDNTLKCINDNLIANYGGYIKVRKQDGKRYLDYYREEDRPVSPQEIRFGNNLLDFTRSFDATDFCTVVIPLGCRLENSYGISMSGIDGVTAYTTIEEVNDGKDYIVNQEALETFGWIEKIVHFDDVDDPEELMELGQQYLSEVQFMNVVLEINAVDLSYMNVDVDYIQLSEEVRCISRPHGLDMRFPVKKISIPLDNPANTSFTMGYDIKQSYTPISAKTNTGNDNIKKEIQGNQENFDDVLEKFKNTILLEARTRAHELINSFTRGYITITTMENGSNELYVTDEPISEASTIDDVKAKCTRFWRWNLHGLGFYDRRGFIGNPNYKDPADGLALALTMDGRIVADYITAGVMQAGIIKAGILKANFGDSYWNMETGELYISGSAKYGDSTIEHRFEVAEDSWTSSYSDLSGKYSTISQTVDGISTRVTGVEGNYSTLSQTVDGISTRVTGVEGNYSSISQTVNSISLTVSDKVSKGDVSSQLSLEDGAIKIKSNRLEIQSSNFTLSPNGTMWCQNGEFSGSVSAGERGDDWIKIEYGEIKGGNGWNEEAKINFHGVVSGNSGCHIEAGEVVFSADKIGVTDTKGGPSVSYGSNGNFIGLNFIDGICTSVPDEAGSSGNFAYMDEQGNCYLLKFKNGIFIKRESNESPLYSKSITLQRNNRMFKLNFKNGLLESVEEQ